MEGWSRNEGYRGKAWPRDENSSVLSKGCSIAEICSIQVHWGCCHLEFSDGSAERQCYLKWSVDQQASPGSWLEMQILASYPKPDSKSWHRAQQSFNKLACVSNAYRSLRSALLHIGITFIPRLCVCMQSHFSHVLLFGTLWTVAYQVSLSLGFSRQEYWSGLSCPSPGNLPNPGIDPGSPALQADSLPLNLQIALGSMAILKIFILLIQGNRVSFHFFKLSSIPLISVFSGFRL